jgi:hypothetical protein
LDKPADGVIAPTEVFGLDPAVIAGLRLLLSWSHHEGWATVSYPQQWPPQPPHYPQQWPPPYPPHAPAPAPRKTNVALIVVLALAAMVVLVPVALVGLGIQPGSLSRPTLFHAVSTCPHCCGRFRKFVRSLLLGG